MEARVSERQVTVVASDTGELACSHERSFAKNRTITALEPGRSEGDTARTTRASTSRSSSNALSLSMTG